MPTRDQFWHRSSINKDFGSNLLGDSEAINGWSVTAFYYSAVNALSADKTPRGAPQDHDPFSDRDPHDQRKAYMIAERFPVEERAYYRDLKTASHAARYRCGLFTRAQAEVLRDTALLKFRGYISRRTGLSLG